MWKHDNFFIGAIVAVILIIISVILMVLIVPFIYDMLKLGVPSQRILVLAVVPAIAIMRYYMRKLRFTKSGGGALAVVFIAIIAWFVYFADKLETFPTI